MTKEEKYIEYMENQIDYLVEKSQDSAMTNEFRATCAATAYQLRCALQSFRKIFEL